MTYTYFDKLLLVKKLCNENGNTTVIIAYVYIYIYR